MKFGLTTLLVLSFAIAASAQTTIEKNREVYPVHWLESKMQRHLKILNYEVEGAVQALKKGLPTPLCGYDLLGINSTQSLRLAIDMLSDRFGNEFKAAPFSTETAKTARLCLLVSNK